MTDQKRLYLFPLLALAALLPVLSACTNEPIFSTIESEIPLRDPTLEGKVPSLVQFQRYLYACNGRLKRKQGTAAPGSWQEVARPENRRCAALAATDSTLYGLFFSRRKADFTPLPTKEPEPNRTRLLPIPFINTTAAGQN